MASAQQKVLSKTLRGEGVYLALGNPKALPIISSLCSSLALMPEALVDKWRVYADKHNLPENKPMDASALNK